MAKNNALVKHLQKRKAAIAKEYTQVAWDLTLAEADCAHLIQQAAAKRRGELVSEPTDETARLIIAAGRKRRSEPLQ